MFLELVLQVTNDRTHRSITSILLSLVTDFRFTYSERFTLSNACKYSISDVEVVKVPTMSTLGWMLETRYSGQELSVK